MDTTYTFWSRQPGSIFKSFATTFTKRDKLDGIMRDLEVLWKGERSLKKILELESYWALMIIKAVERMEGILEQISSGKGNTNRLLIELQGLSLQIHAYLSKEHKEQINIKQLLDKLEPLSDELGIAFELPSK